MTAQGTKPAFSILGPLEVQGFSGLVKLSAARHRAVLALLLLHHDRLVPTSTIIDALWPQDPPLTANAQVLTVVSALRRTLGDSGVRPQERILVTRQPGYLLRVDPDRFDLDRFDALALDAGAEATAGRLAAAAVKLRGALELWRGPAFADVAAPFAVAAARNLEQRKLAAAQRLADIELSLGAHRELVPLLTAMVDEHPLSEALWARLMLALYRSGDLAAALDAYQSARSTLAEQLGLDPGPELTGLHRAILRREPGLSGSPAQQTGLSGSPAQPGLSGSPAQQTGLSGSPAQQADLSGSPAQPGLSGSPAQQTGLSGSPAQQTGPASAPRPSQLPRAAPLVGRERVAGRIRELLARQGHPPVVALHGPGGVGKSALAIHVAHGVAGDFPDGSLYADLLGATPQQRPLSPGEVLAWFLRALGMPAAELPADPAEAAAQYQSLLARRRILIVLDNAADARQVQPLLPAQPGSAAIVTSRAILSTLDCYWVPIEMLAENEAVALLAQSAGGDRMSGKSTAASEIAQLCGGLPLALRIAGARLAARPDWEPGELAERLRDEHRRLDELSVQDLEVRSCFEIGYSALAGEAAARAFRLLGALNVPEVDLGVVAALLDADTAEAEAAVSELLQARLLEVCGPRRFRMHDLMRLYSAELAELCEPRERVAAVRRCLDWYLAACRQASGMLRGAADASAAPAVLGEVDVAEAIRWFGASLPQIVSALGQVAEGPRELAWFAVEMVESVTGRLGHKLGYWAEMEIISRTALRVARRFGDKRAEALALAAHGPGLWRTGRADATLAAFTRALQLWREVGDRGGEGLARHNVGWFHWRSGDLERAAAEMRVAAELVAAHGNPVTAAMVEHNLGEVLLGSGRYAEAADTFVRVLAARRRNEDGFGESITLASLGRAHILCGRHELAISTLDDALAATRAYSNRHEEWEALLCRSEARLRQGRPAEALADAHLAHGIAGETGDAYRRAATARQFARVYRALGDADRAALHAEAAEALFALVTQRDSEVETLFRTSVAA